MKKAHVLVVELTLSHNANDAAARQAMVKLLERLDLAAAPVLGTTLYAEKVKVLK